MPRASKKNPPTLDTRPYTYVEVEAVACLMHDLVGHPNYDTLQAKWSDALSGATGIYRLIIMIAVQLESVVDWTAQVEQGNGFYDVSAEIASALIARAVESAEPPTTDECIAIVAEALKPRTEASVMPPPEKKSDACMGCWTVPIECSEGCGAQICICNISNHDCDTFKAGGE